MISRLSDYNMKALSTISILVPQCIDKDMNHVDSYHKRLVFNEANVAIFGQQWIYNS